jgi:hypothetical protein
VRIGSSRMGPVVAMLRLLTSGAVAAGVVLVAGCSGDGPERESGDDPGPVAEDAGAVGGVSAQAAVAVSVLPGATGVCPATGGTYSLPEGPDALHAIRTSGGEDLSTGEIYRVVDGEPEITVSCEVSHSGADAYTFTGSIRKTRSVTFTASGTTSGKGGVMSLSEWDLASGLPDTASDETCTLDLADRYVAPGVIWADFRCPQFGDGVSQCVAVGTFIFENCRR